MDFAENRSHSNPNPRKPLPRLTTLPLICHDYCYIVVFTLITLAIWRMPLLYSNERAVPLSMWNPAASFDNTGSSLRPPSDLSYQWKPEPLPSELCGVLVVIIPIVVVIVFQSRNFNVRDLHAGISGSLKAVVATAFVCTILKQVVGGFRPHFVDVCRPDPKFIAEDMALGRYWFNATACSGDSYEVRRAMQSFPSGHAANSFSSGTFITLYLNAKLKTFADQSTFLPTLILTIAPLLLASLVSGSMYVSNQHHANDIVFGIIIGLLFGFSAYRSVYTAVFDFRLNHIPLPFARHAGLVHVHDPSQSGTQEAVGWDGAGLNKTSRAGKE
ncbi:phosphatidic acid phosphatase type 2/haloperoxidase [Amylocarpus encephaloides]|uniref:Phosphatidic acid phosphatase type 2/haloperoxidase n=1 Tax=Amylocarpus encephaloides TaxID=45428 RepID=A0A9P7YI78_9HELO|nr:phosphatidic acid phosphatase type 2/haloperoxidase [Amylocarpus encephaloides]